MSNINDPASITRSRYRINDHATSEEGAKRAGPNLHVKLLDAFKQAGSSGFTDEEAAEAAGVLDTCYWKRCNELRQFELIAHTESSRPGRKGVKRRVSAITPLGRKYAE